MTYRVNNMLKIVLPVVICVGCGGESPSTLFVPERPYIFDQCPTPSADIDRSARSLAGFLKALQDFNWTLNTVSFEQRKINAAACITAGNHTTECVTMTFAVNEEGKVLGYAEPSNPISREMQDAAIRWMRNLDQRFSTYRCMIQMLVAEELGKQGIKLPSPATKATPEAVPTPQAAPDDPSVHPPNAAGLASPTDTASATADPGSVE